VGSTPLVFTGGIGENSPDIRMRAARKTGFPRPRNRPKTNAANGPRIEAGPVPILVLPTDEERVIARATAAALA
jgi:acetate kinase